MPNFGGVCGILVDIEFCDPQPIFVFGGDLVQDRRDHLAGAAPFGPEIQQYRLFSLEDVLIETGVRGMHYVLVTHAVEPPLRGENLIFGMNRRIYEMGLVIDPTEILGSAAHTVPRKAV